MVGVVTRLRFVHTLIICYYETVMSWKTVIDTEIITEYNCHLDSLTFSRNDNCDDGWKCDFH